MNLMRYSFSSDPVVCSDAGGEPDTPPPEFPLQSTGGDRWFRMPVCRITLCCLMLQNAPLSPIKVKGTAIISQLVRWYVFLFADPQFVLWFQSTNRGQFADAMPHVPAPPAPRRPFPEVPNLPEDISHTTAVNLKTALLPSLPSVPAFPCTTPPQPVEVDGGAKSSRAFWTSPNLEREDTFTAISGGPDTYMNSLSDFSSPGSSTFSRSTSLSSRGSSVLFGKSS